MKHFFSNQRLLLTLAGLVLATAIISFTIGSRTMLWPEKFVKDSVSWLQVIIAKPAHQIAGLFEDLHMIRLTFQENQRLKASLQQYVFLVGETEELRAENARLRKMLDFQKETKDYTIRIADVIARNPDQWNNLLVIDKGLKNGIKQEMAVITPEGMVGYVERVSNFSANVRLITDQNPQRYISAKIAGKPVNGWIEGYDAEKKMLIMNKATLDAPVNVGDLVITSGLGGVYPMGLVLGKVAEVTSDNYGLTKKIYVELSAHTDQIDEVFVVERSFIPPEATSENKLQTGYQRQGG